MSDRLSDRQCLAKGKVHMPLVWSAGGACSLPSAGPGAVPRFCRPVVPVLRPVLLLWLGGASLLSALAWLWLLALALAVPVLFPCLLGGLLALCFWLLRFCVYMIFTLGNTPVGSTRLEPWK